MVKLPSKATLNRLMIGSYDDPFAILGMHETVAGLEVRVLMPDAISVSVIDKKQNKKVAELSLIDPRGFLAGVIPRRKKRFDYLLEVSWPTCTQRFDDAYSFGILLQEMDNWLLAEGCFLRPYECLGCHPCTLNGVSGAVFMVWAPNAQRVSVVGDFNFWDGRRNPMRFRQESGIWELFLPQVALYDHYKYEIIDCHGNLTLKADPYALNTQMRPQTASCVQTIPELKPNRPATEASNALSAPISIYEVHLGSWRRNINNHYWLSYQELAQELIPYVKDMGFTHIELLPITEYPLDESWGYQPLGLYAPTRRYGTPEEFSMLIEAAHAAGLSVILDWVPGHFPKDQHGLASFDGTALYEYCDPKEGVHQDWHTLIYNYGRHEVRNYLTGNALYWLERFGLDGLRVDAVASMIYRDYSREEGEWVPNKYGGRENIEAIAFLQTCNQIIGRERPGAITIAEESTAFSGVTLPPENGGLGFHYKWNMGWMNDTLRYMQLDPVYRKYHHDLMTFGMLYAYTENFVLSLSHDEVVHGKGSMIDKMPGDVWQKFANLRAYYGFMWGYPGKKLLFMGNEFAQGREWNHQTSLDWYLLDSAQGGPWHLGVQHLVRDLNFCYQSNPPLYQLDFDPAGMQWLVVDDYENSVFAFARRDNQGQEVIVVSNFTPVPHFHYRIGINERCHGYREILNTDSSYYAGSNLGNSGYIVCEEQPSHGRLCSIVVTVPPLSTIYLLKES